jgi:argininosuccinate synthase
MVAHDPTARPSCGEILGELLEEGLWVRPTPAAVESIVGHLQKEVAGLKVRLQTRDAEVAALRSLLDASGIPHDHIPTDTHTVGREDGSSDE